MIISDPDFCEACIFYCNNLPFKKTKNPVFIQNKPYIAVVSAVNVFNHVNLKINTVKSFLHHFFDKILKNFVQPCDPPDNSGILKFVIVISNFALRKTIICTFENDLRL